VVDTRGLKRRYRTMPFLQVNGTRLHYERTGAGDPLVLVHGSWVDSGVWEAVLPTLARSFDVVSYDRRGHSRSSCPPGEGSIRDDVEDLAGLIELLGLSPACVAGASLGGSITLRLAAARPELVRSAAVHEPPLFDLLKSEDADWPELAELRLRLAAVATRLEAGDLEGGARLYFDRVAATDGGWTRLDPGQRRMLLANALTYFDQCCDPDALDIDLESLAAFEGPVLVTYGDLRPPFFKRIVELLVLIMPGASAEPIPGTAHDPQVTHPDSYVRAVEKLACGELA
jgi:pimeloyl-ACP methyl ester carboxylesterase